MQYLGWMVCVALLAAGCGGGGSSSPVVSTKSFNVKSGFANYISVPHSYTFSGSGNVNGTSVTLSGTGELSALSGGLFEGQAALTQTQTTNLLATFNGSQRPLISTDVSYYASADSSPLGRTSSGTYEVMDAGATYPTAAKVGDTGQVLTSKVYSDSSKTTQLTSATSTYLIESDSADSVIVKVVTVSQVTLPANDTQTETVKYRLTDTGTLTLISDAFVSVNPPSNLSIATGL